MYTGQAEKYISTVLTFGERATISASKTAVVNAWLPAAGGTYAGTALAVVIPRAGMLKNLYWSAFASALTAAGNKVTVYVNTTPTGLVVTWNGNIRSGSNIGTSVPVVAGDVVSVQIQLAQSATVVAITQPRVSFELEVAAQQPNPWDLTGPIVSYTGGKVGIGTAAPTDQLHVKNAAAGGIAGVFETPATGKILSGKVGATEKFNVDGGGNVYASGKVGIGTTTPATELDVNGTIQTKGLKLTTGANNGYVLTSNAAGVGTWQPTGGAAGTISGNGTDNAIPRFVGPNSIGDSLIFQNGGNIGIDTNTPGSTLEVNGTVQLGANGVCVDSAGNVGIGTTSPATLLNIVGTGVPRKGQLWIPGNNGPGDGIVLDRSLHAQNE